MPVELRKRKAPQPAPAPPPAKKKTTKVAKAGKAVPAKVKEAAVAVKPSSSSKPEAKKPEPKAKAAEPVTKPEVKTNGSGSAAPAKSSAAAGKPVVGEIIILDGFGGEVQTNDGKKTTLKALVDESKAGIVIFTYPKASTPGCTNQVCLFRDSYAPLTAGGVAIYGMSTDSVKANTTFLQKQGLPYPLLSDTSGTLLAAIGLKKPGPKAGAQRGVFAVDKQGKVLLAEPGSPAGTVDAVKKLVSGMPAPEVAAEVEKEDPAAATTEEEDGGDDGEGEVNGEVAKGGPSGEKKE